MNIKVSAFAVTQKSLIIIWRRVWEWNNAMQ